MTMNVKYTSFNLHIAGLTANQKQAELPENKTTNDLLKRRTASVASGAAVLTDPNRDFTADGFTTGTHRIKIFTDDGNIARDAALTAVGTTTVTVDGGDFDTNSGLVVYRIYEISSTTEIVNDQSKRGTGLVGYQEFLAAIETLFSITLETKKVDLSYHENLTQQVLVFDDA